MRISWIENPSSVRQRLLQRTNTRVRNDLATQALRSNYDPTSDSFSQFCHFSNRFKNTTWSKPRTEKHNSEMKSFSPKLYSSIMKPFTASLSGSRNFCQQLPPFKMTPAIRQKNLITAVSLLAGVFGVYYLAMFKMKETDDLESIIAVETLESDIKR